MSIFLLKNMILLVAATAQAPTSQEFAIDNKVKYEVTSKKINSKNTYNTTIIYEKAPTSLSNPFND